MDEKYVKLKIEVAIESLEDAINELDEKKFTYLDLWTIKSKLNILKDRI